MRTLVYHYSLPCDIPDAISVGLRHQIQVNHNNLVTISIKIKGLEE